MRRPTACAVELIRWPRYPFTSPHEVKVRIVGLLDGADTVTRRFSNLRRAKQVARALAMAIGCEVTKIDMREEARK